MKKIKKGDPVIVIAGKHKGKITSVMKVSEDKVFLEGVNIVKKAVKGQGFQEKVLPIHISNVMYYLKDKEVAVRIGVEFDKKGKKVRVAKKEKVTIA